MALKTSTNAASQLLQFIKTNKCRFVRFGATKKQSLFQYTLTPIQELEPNSTVVFIDQEHGVELCSNSEFLLGTEIGWEQDTAGARYVFNVPCAE